MRDKEKLKDEERARQEQARLLAEEEEVRKIREQSNFKATPIKHYKNNLGAVPEKKLTVPVEPKLQTYQRAAMKSDMQDWASLGRSTLMLAKWE